MHSSSSCFVLQFACWRLTPGMAPHLTWAELDFTHERKQDGLTPVQIHARLAAQRTKKKIATPHLAGARKALKGKVCKRGRVETRGRRPEFTRAMVLRMDVARKKLIKKADNQREVRWGDIRRSARVPEGHRNTLKTAFGREDILVAARRPREKPQRTADHEAERLQFAKDHARSYISLSRCGIACVSFSSQTGPPSSLESKLSSFARSRFALEPLSVRGPKLAVPRTCAARSQDTSAMALT